MTNYERGFIAKCAEYGVDPAELVKQAVDWNPLTGLVGPVTQRAAKESYEGIKQVHQPLTGLVGPVTQRAAKGFREGVNKHLEDGNPIYDPTFKLTEWTGFVPTAKAGIRGIRDEFSKSPVQQMLDKYDGKKPPKPSRDVSNYYLPEHISQQAQQAAQRTNNFTQPRLEPAPSRPRFK